VSLESAIDAVVTVVEERNPRSVVRGVVQIVQDLVFLPFSLRHRFTRVIVVSWILFALSLAAARRTTAPPLIPSSFRGRIRFPQV